MSQPVSCSITLSLGGQQLTQLSGGGGAAELKAVGQQLNAFLTDLIEKQPAAINKNTTDNENDIEDDEDDDDEEIETSDSHSNGNYPVPKKIKLT